MRAQLLVLLVIGVLIVEGVPPLPYDPPIRAKGTGPPITAATVLPLYVPSGLGDYWVCDSFYNV